MIKKKKNLVNLSIITHSNVDIVTEYCLFNVFSCIDNIKSEIMKEKRKIILIPKISKDIGDIPSNKEEDVGIEILIMDWLHAAYLRLNYSQVAAY